MTIITLHHLFFGHCVNLSVIILDLGIFSSGAMLPQKNTSVQNNHLWFHTINLKKDGAQLLLSNCDTVTAAAILLSRMESELLYLWIVLLQRV